MKIQRSSLMRILPFIVLIIAQLHLLRNVTPLYLLVFLFAFFSAIWYALVRWHLISGVERLIICFLLLIFLFPIFAVVPGIMAGKYNGFGDIALGISRIVFALPIYLVIICMPSDSGSINKLLLTAALITLVAALSIPYQFIFGAVEWFAESSERAGFARYASLFGSLTALGIVCGYGVLTAVVSIRSTILLAFVLVGIVVGGILSLQKAAIANMLIALLVIPLVKKVNIKGFLKLLFAFIFLFSVVGMYFIDEILGFTNSFRLFSGSDSSYTDDLSFSESIIERVIDQPMVAINFHGFNSLYLGLGPIGGGGGFGFPDIPNAHNGLVELVLLGGAGYFLLFFGFVSLVLSYGFNNLKRGHEIYIIRFGIFCFCAQILNMIFSGVILFAPSNAIFLAISIKCILMRVKTSTHARPSPDRVVNFQFDN